MMISRMILFACALLLIGACTPTKGTTAKLSKATILTSAQCDMCKEIIEAALANSKGMETYRLDVTTKKLRVTYNPAIISLEEIRQIISTAGYDADDIKANKTAYEDLPACCKKGGMQ